jgi:hypothetical protein
MRNKGPQGLSSHEKNAIRGMWDKQNLRQDITLQSFCVYFLIKLTTLTLVWVAEFSCWLILVRPCVLCCWLSWPLTLAMPYCGTKLTYILMVAICNLQIEYGHCTVKHTCKTVFNSVAKVTNGLWVSLAILYIAKRIKENIWSICDNK